MELYLNAYTKQHFEMLGISGPPGS